MRKVRLLEEAIVEATEAAAWYEQECGGLGIEFSDSVEAALDILEADIVPLTTMPGLSGDSGVKRLVLSRFPYDVVVVPLEYEVVVIAIAHQSRLPGYWQDRKAE